MSGAALPLARGGMDRDAVARTDPALFDRLWAEPGTRVLVLHEGRAPIRGQGQPGPRHEGPGRAIQDRVEAEEAPVRDEEGVEG